MRVLILGNANRKGVKEETERLLPIIARHAEIAAVDLYQRADLSEHVADLALVLGGDGAILRAARQMGYRQIPVLGINLGKLGFLADLTPDQVCACFPKVVQGEYRVSRHLMFECIPGADGQQPPILGLNEVLVHTDQSFHMIDLDLAIDGEVVTRFSGDGLIISTPIGSTAHSLSAGGPILGQELDAFVITPICAHTLVTRPVVDSCDKTYTVSLVSQNADAVLIIDGREPIPLKRGELVTLRKAPVSFGLVKVHGHTFFQTLRDKLRWGVQPNYRHEQTSRP
jgi:NAD+ kinase